MARVEVRPSGLYRYAVVVDDVWTGTAWKKRTLKSFGNAENPNNLTNAEQFCAVYNAATELQKQNILTKEMLKTIAKGVAYGGAAALLLKLIFDND